MVKTNIEGKHIKTPQEASQKHLLVERFIPYTLQESVTA